MLSPTPATVVSATGGYESFVVTASNGTQALALWRAAKPYGHAADPNATIRAALVTVDGGDLRVSSPWTSLVSTDPLTEVSAVGLDWDALNQRWVMLALVKHFTAGNTSKASSYDAALLASPDASSWTVLTPSVPTSPLAWFYGSDLKINGATIVIAGYGAFHGASSWSPVTLSSTDAGRTWTKPAAPTGLPTTVTLPAEPQILRTPAGWLMAIRSDTDWSIHTATSTDARTWTYQGVAIRNASGLPELGITRTGEIVMLLRQKPTIDTTHGAWAWATSLDGQTWTYHAEWPDEQYMLYGGLAPAGDGLICVYASEDDRGAPWRSASIYATHLTTRPLPTPNTTPALAAAVSRWRYVAFSIDGDGTEELISSDLDLTDVTFDVVLSGTPAFSATIPTESAYLTRSGEPVLKPWGTSIYVEEDGQIRGGFIVTEVTESGPKLSISAVGFTGFAAGTPYGGEKSFVQTDALDVLRHIWQHIQSQPGGNIGLVLDDTKSGVLLGRQSVDQLPLYVDNSRLPALPAEGTLWRFQRTKTPAKPAVKVKRVDPKTKKVTVTTTPAKPAVVETLYGESRRTVPKPLPAGSEVIVRERKNTQVSWVEGPEDGFPADRFDVVGIATKQAPKEGTEGDQLQPFTLQWFADSDLQQKIDAVFEQGNFDWWEEHAWAGNRVTHRVRFATPLAGRVRDDLRFVVGENILNDPDLQQKSDDYASEVVVLGAGEGRAMVKGTWKMTNPPRVRRVKTVTDKSIRSKADADRRAEREGLATNGGQNIASLVVQDHPNAPLGAWQLGDTVLVQGSGQGWAGEWSVKVRILAYTVQSETDTATLTVARAERARL